MNKQELIKEFRKIGIYNLSIFSTEIKGIPTESAITLIEQLDEPKPVKVPQFVADWIESYKREIDIRDAMSKAYVSVEVDNWLMEVDADGAFVNQDLFAHAWLDGYEVEKEKRYRISMPKARNYMNHAQFLCEKDGKIFWCGEWHPFRTKFTRKQLEEAGFGWVFNCEGVEIEEVTE